MHFRISISSTQMYPILFLSVLIRKKGSSCGGSQKCLLILNVVVNLLYIMQKYICLLSLVILFWGCEKASDSFSATTTGQGGSLARFTIVGDYLYTVDHANLKVFEITDPTQPVLKRSVQ